MEAALKKEVTALKKEARSEERRFQVVRSGANNCVFIRTTIEQPDDLVHNIFADIHKTQTSKSRFILRLQPVIASCKAEEEKIERLAEEVLPAFFGEAQGGHTFSILFKVRNNNKVGRNTVLPLVAKVISDMCAGNKVNLDAPELVVCVDVIRTVCCISVLKDFAQFRKYNLQEIVTVKEDKNGSSESKETDQEKEGGGEGPGEMGDGEGEEKETESGTMKAAETLISGELSQEGERPADAGDVTEQTLTTSEVKPPVCETAAV